MATEIETFSGESSSAKHGFFATLLCLMRAEFIKLSRYWVVLAGYAAIAIVAIPGAALFYLGEQTIDVTSASGYEFAFNLMGRCLDFASSILFVILCILFSIDVSNSTIKYILTRPITRSEFLVSKYAVALSMVIATLILLWIACLCAGAYYYGLGDLRENDYLLFSAGEVFRNIGMASLFLVVALMAQASMALAISTYSNTMGGAIIVGLILYSLVGIIGIIPVNLGITLGSAENELFFSFSTLSFTDQLLIPLLMLEDLPAGVPIESWWTSEIHRLLIVCGSTFCLFFGMSFSSVRKRDFTL